MKNAEVVGVLGIAGIIKHLSNNPVHSGIERGVSEPFPLDEISSLSAS
ncbi:MAG TPA: hypothetical protein VFH31_16505 [Pyrinomonadaceae bacterium]|nr:hypothetical protein [Pyrinomonadaceae bacterium]